MRVSLTSVAKYSCWFRIMPRFKLRSEGDTVMEGDHVSMIALCV